MRRLIPFPKNRDEPDAFLFIGVMNEMFPMSEGIRAGKRRWKLQPISFIDEIY